MLLPCMKRKLLEFLICDVLLAVTIYLVIVLAFRQQLRVERVHIQSGIGHQLYIDYWTSNHYWLCVEFVTNVSIQDGYTVTSRVVTNRFW